MLANSVRSLARRSLALRVGANNRVGSADQKQRQSVRAYAAKEIPVNTVCRMLQCKVPDEAAAMEMDSLLNECDGIMKKIPGFVGSTRMVCKSYWDYKSLMVFESGDALGGYLESEVREKEILPLLEKGKAFAVDGDIKMQNFVYDQLK